MFKKFSHTTFILILIFILALILRIFNLSTNPPALNWDEVSHGYNAYSILKTGSDEWGQIFPLTNFRAYGDYPLTLYMYLTMPWIIIFGLNEFSIRLTAAIFGSLMVLLIFFMTKQFTGNVKIALLSAFLIAISPWSILTSRQVLQSTPAIFFLTLGILLFFKGLKKSKWLIFSGLSFGLSAYGYHNTRILVYPLIIILFLLYRRNLFNFKKTLLMVGLILVVMAIPIGLAFLSNEVSARAVWVGILDQGAVNHINELRGSSTLPGPLPIILYNKPLYFIEKTVSNYIGYFNPIFLGFSGGSQYQFSIPGLGIVYPIELVPFYLGIVLLFLNFLKNIQLRFLLIWLLFAPLPAAVTRDESQVVRSTIMLPVFYLVTALGLEKIADFFTKFNKKLSSVFMVAFIFISLILFANFYTNYFTDYRVKYSFAWQYGYKKVANFIKENNNKYNTFYITKKYGEPHEFLLFYLQYDPQKYKTDPNLIRYNRSNWFWVDQFDRYSFLNDWEIKDKTKDKKSGILITSPGNYPQNARKIETINFLNDEPAFDIMELK
ncbi:MAG: glycosyltransferase family 39 protein [Candidatus Daviesbacteria bacterium]|nr:glycosyltransferase family 39 protein [Candidatus Daviesbacteria bacterium]